MNEPAQPTLLSCVLLDLQKALHRFCGNLAFILADYLAISTPQANHLIQISCDLYPLLAYREKIRLSGDKLPNKSDIIESVLNKTNLHQLDKTTLPIDDDIIDHLANTITLSRQTIQQGFTILWQIFEYYINHLRAYAKLDDRDYLTFLTIQATFFNPQQSQLQNQLGIHIKPTWTQLNANSPIVNPTFDNPNIPPYTWLSDIATHSQTMPTLAIGHALADKLPKAPQNQTKQPIRIMPTVMIGVLIIVSILIMVIVLYQSKTAQKPTPQPTKPIAQDIAIIRTDNQTDDNKDGNTQNNLQDSTQDDNTPANHNTPKKPNN